MSTIINLQVPLMPPKHVSHPFFTWLVTMMDEYRDIRLIGDLLQSVLMISIVGLVVYFIYRVWKVEKQLKQRYQMLEQRIQRINELHEQIDKLNADQGG